MFEVKFLIYLAPLSLCTKIEMYGEKNILEGNKISFGLDNVSFFVENLWHKLTCHTFFSYKNRKVQHEKKWENMCLFLDKNIFKHKWNGISFT